MPKNCSKDLELVIEHVDSVLDKGDADEIAKLQKSFGLEGLGHVDDFAAYDQLSPVLTRRLYTN